MNVKSPSSKKLVHQIVPCTKPMNVINVFICEKIQSYPSFNIKESYPRKSHLSINVMATPYSSNHLNTQTRKWHNAKGKVYHRISGFTWHKIRKLLFVYEIVNIFCLNFFSYRSLRSDMVNALLFFSWYLKF